MRNHSLAYFFVASLMVTGCRYKELDGPEPIVNLVQHNERFSVNLPESHTKKEMWTVRAGYDTAIVKRLNEVWHGDEKGVDFNFRAVKTGTTKLTFIKRVYQDTVETVNYLVKITDN